MIFYSWIALSGSNRIAPSESGPMAPSESDWIALSESGPMVSSGGRSGTVGSPVAMGITDDRGRAMKAGEETLRSGQAAVVVIEAVRPALAAHTLARCYVRAGVAWLGRCTESGEVTWNRFFPSADPDDQQAPGRIEP